MPPEVVRHLPKFESAPLLVEEEEKEEEERAGSHRFADTLLLLGRVAALHVAYCHRCRT